MLQDDEVDWENQGQDPALQQALAVIRAKGQARLRSCILCQGHCLGTGCKPVRLCTQF